MDVDENLGANAPGPRVVASDGGIVEAGDDAELLSDNTDGDGGGDAGRPDDCDCIPAEEQTGTVLECWPCRREGFETVNPDASADGDAEGAA